MKIQSKFKDYYDYVEYLYSPEGGDPTNTYVRRDMWQSDRLNSGHEHFTVEKVGVIPDYPQPKSDRIWNRGPESPPFRWTYTWCSVCGKLYLLVSERSDPRKYKLITETHPSLSLVYSKSFGDWFKEPTIKDLIGVPNSACVKISKELQTPVFILNDDTYTLSRKTPEIIVPRVTPNLGDLGFASLISAEQIYQEIAMFLTSLRGNPDSLPPVNISDKDRLTQKGFDAKISFRGKPPK
jgi:hypothetical protein